MDVTRFHNNGLCKRLITGLAHGNLMQGFLFVILLFFQTERLFEEQLHLTHGVAADHRDFNSLIFKILQCSRLTLLLSLQRQHHIGTRWCPRERYLNMTRLSVAFALSEGAD